MCEINPKHKAFFNLEVFTSDGSMNEEEFTNLIMEKLLRIEQLLNSDHRFRFHIHSKEA